jgi:hypothetical protein
MGLAGAAATGLGEIVLGKLASPLMPSPMLKQASRLQQSFMLIFIICSSTRCKCDRMLLLDWVQR